MSFFTGSDFYLMPDGPERFLGDVEPHVPLKIHPSMKRPTPYWFRPRTPFESLVRPRPIVGAVVGSNIATDLLINGLVNLAQAYMYRPGIATWGPPSGATCVTGAGQFLSNGFPCSGGTSGTAGPGTFPGVNPGLAPFNIEGINVNYWFTSGIPPKWYANFSTMWRLAGAAATNYYNLRAGRQINVLPLPMPLALAQPTPEPNQLPSPVVQGLPDPTGWPTRLPRALRLEVQKLQQAVGVRDAGNEPPPRPNDPEPRPPSQPPEPPLPPHDKKPPGRGVKERKAKTNFPKWFAQIMNLLTETDDWLDAAIDSMPKDVRCKFLGKKGMKTTFHKAQFVAGHWPQVDMKEFMLHAGYNLLEDYLIGRGSRYEQETMQKIFDQWGLNVSFMPSTVAGHGLKTLMKMSPKPPSECKQ